MGQQTMQKNACLAVCALSSLCTIHMVGSPAFAEEAINQWSATTEFEFENSTAGVATYTFKPSIGYRFGDNKIDLMTELSQDQISGENPLSGKLELRYKRYFTGPYGFNPEIRFGIGELFNNNANGGNFPYYTVKPYLTKQIGPIEWFISYRWRDAFDTSNNYQSQTAYFGGEYEFAKGWSIEPAYFHKWEIGQETNGFEIELEHVF